MISQDEIKDIEFIIQKVSECVDKQFNTHFTAEERSAKVEAKGRIITASIQALIKRG